MEYAGRLSGGPTMKRTVCMFALVAALWGRTSQASAEGRMFEVWASGLIGGAVGNGAKGVDYYNWTSGGATGFEAGLRFFFLSTYVEYLHFFGGHVSGDLWSVNLGGDSEFHFGEHWGLVLRLAGTYYFGSIDKGGVRIIDGNRYTSDAVSTQGAGARIGLGPRYNFNKFLSIGATPTVGYHYFFKNSSVDVAGRSETSHGWDFQALAYLRVAIGI